MLGFILFVAGLLLTAIYVLFTGAGVVSAIDNPPTTEGMILFGGITFPILNRAAFPILISSIP